jgi:hypothetical protein
LEGKDLVDFAADEYHHVCLLDFAGSGLSEGEYITLGHFEKDDVLQLLSICVKKYQCKSAILWGRSMGAATVMLTLGEANIPLTIDCIVLDSPFMDLKKVYQKCVKKVVSLPNFLINMIYAYAKKRIKAVVGFNISKVKPVNFISYINCPVVLMASKTDELVEYSDIKKLNKSLRHLKTRFIKTEGAHNEDRCFEELELAFEFIKRECDLKHKKQSGQPTPGKISPAKGIQQRIRNNSNGQNQTTPLRPSGKSNAKFVTDSGNGNGNFKQRTEDSLLMRLKKPQNKYNINGELIEEYS